MCVFHAENRSEVAENPAKKMKTMKRENGNWSERKIQHEKKNIYIAGNRKKDEAKMAHTEKKET